MKIKTEWANTDSRVTIVEDGDDVILTVVYEADTDITYEAAVTMPRKEFRQLVAKALANAATLDW